MFKNSLKALLPVVALALLGACATQTLPPGGATTEAVSSACDTFGAALQSVTPLKPKLSKGDINRINAAILLTSPICENPASYNTNGALSAVITETGNIQAVLKANGSK